ncbi:MAG: ClbS/DfsB family four-helix bundle protein [Caldilineales bacterium]|nr:ClbS/DfsB family four-helix bundle protein [Caldilineales bacterium]
MDVPQSKQELQAFIAYEHDRLQRALDRIDPAFFTTPGVESDWSVKDVLVHITGWEQMMLGWIQTLAAGETPDRQSPGQDWPEVDRINADLYEKYRAVSMPEIESGFHASFAEVKATIEAASDALLFDENYSAWNNGVACVYLVAANTGWHYADHVEALEHWADLHPAASEGGR